MNQGRIISFVVTQIGRGFSGVQFPGKWRTVHAVGGILSRVCPEAYCFPYSGERITVRLADRIERLMWARCYEPELISIMKFFLAPGMVFVDVGANIGFFTVLGASIVGENGGVHAFEPDPDCFQRLRYNTLNYSWVYTYPMAVSDKLGEITFNKSPRDGESGWGTILATEEPRPSVRISAVTLDHWLSEKNIGRVDFMKVDVEGAEPRVLCGAKMTMEKHRPVLFLEVNKVCLARDGKSSGDILYLLKDASYSVQGLYDLKTETLLAFLAIPEEKFDSVDRRMPELSTHGVKLGEKL